MSEHVALREVEPAQSQDERAVTKGLGLVSTPGDSDSTSDSENGDGGSRAERMRKIRLMRQTVARSVTGGRGPRSRVSVVTHESTLAVEVEDLLELALSAPEYLRMDRPQAWL